MTDHDSTQRARHWEEVYARREDAALTWFEARPDATLDLISGLLGEGPATDGVIDVGGGTSRLVDGLIARGCGSVTVLDIAPAALATARGRLGARAQEVSWIAADITHWRPDRRWSVWHDRAVFHFLTDTVDRAAYVAAMTGALSPRGHAIIASFAEDGPESCSGLPVCRYTPATLFATIDRHAPGAFRPVGGHRHIHVTPKGNRQPFQIVLLERTAALVSVPASPK